MVNRLLEDTFDNQRTSSGEIVFQTQSSSGETVRSRTAGGNKSKRKRSEDDIDGDNDAYDKLKGDQLKDLLGKRGLTKTGRVGDMRDRLRAHDEKINQAQKEKEMVGERPLCENCPNFEHVFVTDAPAYFFCEDCDNLKMCNTCQMAHKFVQITTNHTILPLVLYTPHTNSNFENHQTEKDLEDLSISVAKELNITASVAIEPAADLEERVQTLLDEQNNTKNVEIEETNANETINQHLFDEEVEHLNNWTTDDETDNSHCSQYVPETPAKVYPALTFQSLNFVEETPNNNSSLSRFSINSPEIAFSFSSTDTQSPDSCRTPAPTSPSLMTISSPEFILDTPESVQALKPSLIQRRIKPSFINNPSTSTVKKNIQSLFPLTRSSVVSPKRSIISPTTSPSSQLPDYSRSSMRPSSPISTSSTRSSAPASLSLVASPTRLSPFHENSRSSMRPSSPISTNSTRSPAPASVSLVASPTISPLRPSLPILPEPVILSTRPAPPSPIIPIVPAISEATPEPEMTEENDPGRSKKRGKNIVPEEYKEKTVTLSGGQWSKSRDGSDVFCHQGRSYKVKTAFVKKNGDRVLYMKCRNESEGCVGKGVGVNKITEGVLEKPNHPNHVCESDPLVQELLSATDKVRKLALTTSLPPSQIIITVLSEMSPEARPWFEGTTNWTKTIQYHRQKTSGPMAKNLATMEIPDYRLQNGERFIKCDNKNEERRIIIMGGDDGIRYLGHSDWWMADGTFRCTPTTLSDAFHQFYVYHGSITGTNGKKVTFPLAFTLMQKRKREDYEEVEEQLTKKMREMNVPIKVMQGGNVYNDMEQAAIQSNKCCLPGARCKICFFHLAQMSTETISAMGDKAQLQDPTYKHHIRMINSIAFCPLEKVDETWAELKIFLEGTRAFKLWEHWDFFYVKGGIAVNNQTNQRYRVEPMWCRTMWNVYRETVLSLPRTTNSAESWHRRLEAIFLNPHPNINMFVESLMKEWIYIQTCIAMTLRGDGGKVKKTMSAADEKREVRIKDTALRFSSFPTNLDYLHAMADATRKSK